MTHLRVLRFFSRGKCSSCEVRNVPIYTIVNPERQWIGLAAEYRGLRLCSGCMAIEWTTEEGNEFDKIIKPSTTLKAIRLKVEVNWIKIE